MWTVTVPLRLLLAPDLSPSAKVLWMLVRLKGTSATAQLQAASGLAATTIRRAAAELERAGWQGGLGAAMDRAVLIPGELLVARGIGTSAKLLYAILQSQRDVHKKRRFTYQGLATAAGMSLNTVKTAVRRLRQAGWVQLTRAKQTEPIRFTLRNPAEQHHRRILIGIKRRIRKAEHKGEAIMRECLSVIIASDQYDDDASPGFLVNTWTGEEMELDRYYPPHVAFEFQGPQHDGPTEQFPDEDEAIKLQARDDMKAGICQRRGIKLVLVYPQDLSFERLREKVPDVLPRNNLDGAEPLIAYLEQRCQAYREEAAKSPARTCPQVGA